MFISLSSFFTALHFSSCRFFLPLLLIISLCHLFYRSLASAPLPLFFVFSVASSLLLLLSFLLLISAISSVAPVPRPSLLLLCHYLVVFASPPCRFCSSPFTASFVVPSLLLLSLFFVFSVVPSLLLLVIIHRLSRLSYCSYCHFSLFLKKIIYNFYILK